MRSEARVPELDLPIAVVEDHAIVEGHRRQHDLELRELGGESRHEALEQRQGWKSGGERLATLLARHDRRAPEEPVAAGVVEVVVGVDELGDRSARRLLDGRHEALRHGGDHQRVHGHRGLGSDDEPGVGDAGVAARIDARPLHVGEDPGTDLDHPALPPRGYRVTGHVRAER